MKAVMYYHSLEIKAQPLYTGAMLNLRDRVLDEVERNSSLVFQVRGTNVLKSVCPHLKRVVRSFIVKFQRAMNDQLVDFLLIGGWWSNGELALSTFWF